MNKKFSTLLASAMLMTAFSAGAQSKGDVLVFANGTGTKALISQEASDFGKLGLSADNIPSGGAVASAWTGESWDLGKLNAATWTVTAKKSVYGKDLYSFVNKATGLALAVDPATAYATASPVSPKPLTLGGTATEWELVYYNSTVESIFVSYLKDGSAIYLAEQGGVFYAVKTTATALASKPSDAFAVQPGSKSDVNDPSTWLGWYSLPVDFTLTAENLNTMLQSAPANGFNLKMDPTVSEGFSNLLTASTLKAVTAQATGSSTAGYVSLQVKGQKVDGKQAYAVVDTAYYAATETGNKHLKFTYGKAEDAAQLSALTVKNRLADSYNYKFTYNVQKNELYIQVQKVLHTLGLNSVELKANSNSNWVQVTGGTAEKTEEDQYIYMAGLASTRLLTVNTKASQTATLPVPADQRTKITMATATADLVPTTIPAGVYNVQFKSTGGNLPQQHNSYALANLAGEFGWAKQAVRQNFQHMPAAQWVVEQNGTSNTAMVTIQNREFNDVATDDVLKLKEYVQFYAVKGSSDVFYFKSATQKDTLSFIKVADELVKDTKLGYKYVTDEEAMVQSYSFNYLHGLSLEKFLYTPIKKDSVVRVDENDGKSLFRLVKVVKDDHYGVGDSLIRNVYYVKDNYGRYISYDQVNKKYMMKTTPTPFFLKENNCIDGKHYYALVEAKFRHAKLDAVGTADNGTLRASTIYPISEIGKKLADATAFSSNGYTPVYDANGYMIVADNSVVNDLYVPKSNGTNIVLTKVGIGNTPNKIRTYAKSLTNDDAKASVNPFNSVASSEYARVKVSVNDNTLDLEEGNLNDKFVVGTGNEIRTSAFAVEIDNTPLYRRFNNANLGESATDAVDTLSFVENVRGEYLMDEWNEKLQDTNVDYAGIWNAEKAEGKLNFIVDTAWVNRGLGNIKPQYLISVARDDKAATAGIPCDATNHQHIDANGKPCDAAHCVHATKPTAGFRVGKYLVNFTDSVKAKGYKAPYMYLEGGYTRAGFVKAIHVGDSLIVLTNEFKNMKSADLDTAAILKNYKANGLNHFIVNLQGDAHKNVTWSFRYVTPSAAAQETAEEGAVNSFLFESNIYNPAAAEVSVSSSSNDGKANMGNGTKAYAGSIAPVYAAWLKMHNGCLVLTRGDSKFDLAATGSDGALIFNVNQKAADEDMVTDNEEVAVEGVQVIAGNGTVTVQGAAGQNVTIATVLGKAIASEVLTSDNATIACPAGIVLVTVNGETSKVIVK